MESICGRFDNISFDAGPINSRERRFIVFLEPDFPLVSKIEHHLDEYEKVSFSFLFFDDISSCLDICEKCVHNCDYKVISDNSLDKYPNWFGKFVECIYYCQNILLLQTLGVGVYDANRVFDTPEFVSKERFLLYKICETLSNAETLQIMNSVPSSSPEKYLEIFILKFLSSGNDLSLLISSLFSLKNPVINSIIEEMKGNFSIQKKITVIQPSKSLPIIEDEIYPIKDPNNVGLCFIINEDFIKGIMKREGSSQDVSVLESTMKYFNITVKNFPNVPKKFFDDLSYHIDQHFKEKNYSIFFMVIMSHGSPGVILSSDEEKVEISYITTKLSCKSLHKIPKVLIIQACQGDVYLLDLATDGSSDIQFDQEPQKSIKVRTYISDFLIAMSTVEGFRAFRDKNRGSWFIQELCKCMKDNENECFLSIITKTIRRVKSFSLPAKEDCFITQQPEFRSLLEKKLYLKPFF